MDTDEKQPMSDTTRRRLLIGLAGTPILASLPSRSAWGQECSISGMLSGNLSNHVHDCPALGDGRTSQYMATHPVCWPVGNSLTLDFGTMYNGNGGAKEIEPCEVSDLNGKLDNPNKYSFAGGTTLDSLISQILVNFGSTLVWAGGFGMQIMDYLHDGPGYPQQAGAAFLNALHPNISYPYSALEVAEAMATVAGDMSREMRLEDILAHFNASSVESTALVQSCSLS
ncbi:hypothetical protein [Marinobacterium aestuariivivens]|uniref:Uncharacterized protein n=1 Tax=Marinobacterium aestuariivivens TaxID=1698799 RepID=A0ABW1ZUE2_9GAMM